LIGEFFFIFGFSFKVNMLSLPIYSGKKSHLSAKRNHSSSLKFNDGRSTAKLLLVATFLAISMVACKENEKPNPFARYPILLQGQWELTTAYRNDKETQNLTGTYFNFEDEHTIVTNLPLSARPQTEDLIMSFSTQDDSLFIFPKDFPSLPMHIVSLDSQQLVLTTLLHNQHFRFDFERTKE
jgi:hypothetical protein